MLYLLILAIFLLAVWWLSFHPTFGVPTQPRRPEVTTRRYGATDPGPIMTEALYQ